MPRTLNPVDVGSIPTDPTELQALVVKWNDTAFVKRLREFDSHSVLLIFDN